MREVISVHVGQAGVQIGNACCKFSKILFIMSKYAWELDSKRKTRRIDLYKCFWLLNKWRDTDSIIFEGELYTVEHGLSVSRLFSYSFLRLWHVFKSPMVALLKVRKQTTTVLAHFFRRLPLANTFQDLFTLISSLVSSMRSEMVPTGVSSTLRPSLLARRTLPATVRGHLLCSTM